MDEHPSAPPPTPETGAPVSPEELPDAAPGRGSGASSADRAFFGGLAFVVAVLVVVAAYLWRDQQVTPSHYLLISMILFASGAFGVLIRRSALVMFMCIELMLNAVNLAFVTFARMHGNVEGHVVVLFVLVVAAAEVAVGLAIIVKIFQRRMTSDVDELSVLRW